MEKGSTVAIIAISRGSKSGGQELAECLAETLGYACVGREVIQEAAVNLGVSEDDVIHKMKDAPRLWRRHTATRKAYVAAVQAVLAEHVAEGNLVYHGLAGQLLLRGLPAVLRVRLIAPFQARVRLVMAKDDMDRASAERYIHDVDDARARWIKMMYGEDIHDPALYDMVINLESMTVQSACAMVARAVRQPEFATTEEARARLADFCLACRVRAALMSQVETRGLDLAVDARDGLIEISGSVPLLSSGRVENRITEIAQGEQGVRELRLKLQWYDPYP